MTIISKPGFCLNCKKTEAQFKMHKVPYSIKISNDTTKLLKAGYRSYPIVEPNDKLNDKANWDGFNWKMIKGYLNDHHKLNNI